MNKIRVIFNVLELKTAEKCICDHIYIVAKEIYHKALNIRCVFENVQQNSGINMCSLEFTIVYGGGGFRTRTIEIHELECTYSISTVNCNYNLCLHMGLLLTCHFFR